MTRVDRYSGRRRGALVGIAVGFVSLAAMGFVFGIGWGREEVLTDWSGVGSLLGILYAGGVWLLLGVTFGLFYVGPAIAPVVLVVGYLLGRRREPPASA